jgi:hypothetical protein
MINRNWGTTKIPALNNFLQYKAVVNNAPTYTVSQTLPTSSFKDNTSAPSRYQIQVGVRYSFN